jgi:hypothetical protein
MFVMKKFKVGDIVVGNDEASIRYYFTIKNSVLIVTEVYKDSFNGIMINGREILKYREKYAKSWDKQTILSYDSFYLADKKTHEKYEPLILAALL